MKSSKETNQQVTAEVTFLSATGKDPLGKEITSKNIIEFLPDTEDVTMVKAYFESQDIVFRYQQGISATITSERKVFEEFFDVKLKLDKNHFTIQGQDNALNIPLVKLPEAIKEALSNISLADRIHLF